jgi:hypothetical protein
MGAAAHLARALCETGALHEAQTYAAYTLEHLTDGVQPSLVDLAAGELVTVFTATGRHDEGRSLLEWIADDPRWSPDRSQRLTALVRGAIAVGARDLASGLCAGASPHWPMYQAGLVAAQACLAEADGHAAQAAAGQADAAERWRALGAVLEEAYAVLAHGRCLAALGDPAAERTLLGARALFVAIGARPRVEDCDALIAQLSRLSS